MIWILNENKKQIMEKNFIKDSEKKSVKIPIK